MNLFINGTTVALFENVAWEYSQISDQEEAFRERRRIIVLWQEQSISDQRQMHLTSKLDREVQKE